MTSGGSMEEPADELPLELQLDLLVDAELPEAQRRMLLRKIEERGELEEWRDLAIRFLQRQTEKETVRQLMAGGSIVPMEMLELPRRNRFAFLPALRSPTVMATAAGVLIAVTSAMVTLYVVRSSAPGGAPATVTGLEFKGNLPGTVLGVNENIPVSVPVMRAGGNGSGDMRFFPTGLSQTSEGFRDGSRSIVIQPDGKGNAVAIPVSTMKVY